MDSRKMNLLPPPADACQICATRHEPGMPHNCDSLYYQVSFFNQNNRYPTWGDAMAHCTDEIKQITIETLQEYGLHKNI